MMEYKGGFIFKNGSFPLDFFIIAIETQRTYLFLHPSKEHLNYGGFLFELNNYRVMINYEDDAHI
jgi:hypothetical protein